MLRTSHYNFSVSDRDATLVFNARTGALISLHGSDGRALAEALCVAQTQTLGERLPTATFATLVTGGFLVSDGFDEIAAIRDVYWEARRETPSVLTLTTTQDCNLGCFYCYEPRTTERLTAADLPAIVKLTRRRLEERNRSSLH